MDNETDETEAVDVEMASPKPGKRELRGDQGVSRFPPFESN
jgi:hypothetical protein